MAGTKAAVTQRKGKPKEKVGCVVLWREWAAFVGGGFIQFVSRPLRWNICVPDVE